MEKRKKVESHLSIYLSICSSIGFAWRPLSRISCVLVVPTEPQPGLVTPLRRPVKPLVHSPERIKAARVGGVGVVDDAVLERERAHTRRLAGVGGDVVPVLAAVVVVDIA